MPKRKQRELKRRAVPRSKFFVLDGEWFYVTERDEQGLEAVKLDAADAETVRRMRYEGDFDIEAAILGKRK